MHMSALSRQGRCLKVYCTGQVPLVQCCTQQAQYVSSAAIQPAARKSEVFAVQITRLRRPSNQQVSKLLPHSLKNFTGLNSGAAPELLSPSRACGLVCDALSCAANPEVVRRLIDELSREPLPLSLKEFEDALRVLTRLPLSKFFHHAIVTQRPLLAEQLELVGEGYLALSVARLLTEKASTANAFNYPLLNLIQVVQTATWC